MHLVQISGDLAYPYRLRFKGGGWKSEDKGLYGSKEEIWRYPSIPPGPPGGKREEEIMLETFVGATEQALLEIKEGKDVRRTAEVFLLFSLGSQFDHLIRQALEKLSVFCLVAKPSWFGRYTDIWTTQVRVSL